MAALRPPPSGIPDLDDHPDLEKLVVVNQERIEIEINQIFIQDAFQTNRFFCC